MFTANVLFLKKTKSSFHNHTFLSLITLTKVLAYLWRKKGSFSIIWLFFTWIVIISPFPLIKSLMERQSRQSQNKRTKLKVQHQLCLNFNHFHHFNYLSNFKFVKICRKRYHFLLCHTHIKAFTWCSTRSHHILHNLACRVLQVFYFRDTITITGTVAC